MEIYSMIQESTDAVAAYTTTVPEIGIILGTGLGMVVNELEEMVSIDYAQIPHMPASTVESHAGRLLVGVLQGRPVIVQQGRFHLYEGYSMQQITHGVRIMQLMGVRTLIVSNACGGMNPAFKRGDIMLMTDHINLLGSSPLVGPNDERLGPRFPDMSAPYTPRLQELARRTAAEQDLTLREGVYVAVPGPNLETRAEYRYLHGIGADVVGMSTVPEVIVAVHAGMEVLGFSVVTDECFPDTLQPVSISDILEAARMAEPKLNALIEAIVPHI